MTNVSVVLTDLEAFTRCCIVIYDSAYTERINVAEASSSFTASVGFLLMILFREVVAESVASKRCTVITRKLGRISVSYSNIGSLALPSEPVVGVSVGIRIEYVIPSIISAVACVVAVIKSVSVR